MYLVYRKRLSFKNRQYIVVWIDSEAQFYHTPSVITSETGTSEYRSVVSKFPGEWHSLFLYYKQTPFYVRPDTEDPGFNRLGNGLPPENEIVWIKVAEQSEMLHLACYVHYGTHQGLFPVEIDLHCGYANILLNEKYFTGNRTDYYWKSIDK